VSFRRGSSSIGRFNCYSDQLSSKAAFALFVVGPLSTSAGLCLVLIELRVNLDVIEFEHENLGRLAQGDGLLRSDLEGTCDDDQEGGIP